MFPSKKMWDRWCKETEGMGPAEFCAWADKQLKPNDMYQGRREDFDPRVDKVLDEGPKIDKAMADVEHTLRELYKLQGRTIKCVDFHSSFNSDVTATLYYLPANWDYTKEFEESLDKLNMVVLDAYIVFLECEREDLIKRWNDMAKDLKPEKK